MDTPPVSQIVTTQLRLKNWKSVETENEISHFTINYMGRTDSHKANYKVHRRQCLFQGHTRAIKHQNSTAFFPLMPQTHTVHPSITGDTQLLDYPHLRKQAVPA